MQNKNAAKKLEPEKARAVGMAEQAKEFLETGSEIYHGNLHEDGFEQH